MPTENKLTREQYIEQVTSKFICNRVLLVAGYYLSYLLPLRLRTATLRSCNSQSLTTAVKWLTSYKCKLRELQAAF
ncbi:hypothetical protein D3C76_1551320 [compost metagenome]|jgi:hypothetical protein